MRIRIYQTTAPSGTCMMAARLNKFTLVRIYTSDTPKRMRIADFYAALTEPLA